MAKVLVFKHVAAEPLGLLYPMLRSRGHRLRFANFFRNPYDRPTLSRYDALIVLGGPMNVEEVHCFAHLAYEMQAIEAFLREGKPVLGICLGAQLLAHVLGARVTKNAVSEIGWYELTPTAAAGADSVLKALREPAAVFQWHSRTFELPPGAHLLASSLQCPHQAFAYRQIAWGLQFHLEVDRQLIARWLSTPAYLEELRNSDVASTSEQILEQTERYLRTSEALAGAVFSNWLDLLPAKRPRLALPSR